MPRRLKFSVLYDDLQSGYKHQTIRKSVDYWLQVYKEANPLDVYFKGRSLGTIELITVDPCFGFMFNSADAYRDGFGSVDQLLNALAAINRKSRYDVVMMKWVVISFEWLTVNPDEFAERPLPYVQSDFDFIHEWWSVIEAKKGTEVECTVV